MTTAQRPRVLFFGTGGGTARALLVDSGTDDAGATFQFLARSNQIVPTDPTVEIAVFATYLVVTASDTSAPLTLAVSLYVDAAAPLTRTVTVPATTGERQYPFEVGWHLPVLDGSQERVTIAPRGVKIVVELASTGAIPAGRIVIDGVTSEIEVLGETLASAGT